MSPDDGVKIPAIRCNNVVFPDPLGPTMAAEHGESIFSSGT